MTSARLRKVLVEDRTARVDGCGALFYEDPVVAAPPGGPQAAPVPEAAVFPYTATFTLHSRPGALRTIYLDFKGFRLAGSAWNANYNHGTAWDLVPYDSDGNPGSYSNAEQDVVQDVWRRVSEDYAPFDVDVTTEDPGFDAIDRSSAGDPRFGTRAVITDDAVIGGVCNCGGLGYLGAFDATVDTSMYHSYYQPAVVFANNLYGGTDPKSIAEATSHEVGHNLGLSHDGTPTEEYYRGAGVWAPIMGVGYYVPLVQFSKGEYPGASNTEDDFAVITSHGATAAPDDHADVRTSATALGPLPSGVDGEISTAADVDWFRFTGTGGSVTISATPAAVSPNLDMKISLYNSAGTLVASADPASAFVDTDHASGLGATLDTSTLAGAAYYLQIDGVGAGSVASGGYSDYGSTGRYSLSVASDAAPVITTSSLPSTVVGRPYSKLLGSAGGTGALTWSLASGTLPAGLALGTSTGTLSGTPTSNTTTNFTLRVTDGASMSSTRSFTVTPGLAITSQSLPEATTGAAYSATLAGAGGAGPYTWAVTSGSLPAGLSLSGNRISGTPSVVGTTAVTVRMTDSASRTASSVITITVTGPFVLGDQSWSPGVVGIETPRLLYASGGRPSYIWTLESGSVPPGMELTSSGWIQGTPTAVGTFTFTVRATDRSGRTATAGATLVIAPPAPTMIAIAPTSGPAAGGTTVTIAGTNLSGAISVSFGDTPAVSFSVVNATTVTAVSPAHAPGEVDLTVTTPGGTTSAGPWSTFTYLTSALGGLNGTVTTPSGTLRGAQVRIYPTTGTSPVAVAVSAADGTWSVSLPTGSYEVQVVPPSGRHVRRWVGGASRALATDFHVVSAFVGTGTTSLTAR